MTKIVVISDTHCQFKNLSIPKCDILISCGDYSFMGKIQEVRAFHKWLNDQPATHVISVQGNHELNVEKDFCLFKKIAKEECPRVHFIDEGLIELEGIKIWCSAITPHFNDWAWNRARGPEIKRHWDLIPDDIDILVTHGPPYSILDVVYNRQGIPINRVGCQDLLDRVNLLPNLKHHFFGHIHGSYGHEEKNGKHFWNASICGENYHPNNPPVVVEFEK